MKKLSIIDSYTITTGEGAALVPSSVINHTILSMEDVTGTKNNPAPSPNSLTVEVVVTDETANDIEADIDLYINWSVDYVR